MYVIRLESPLSERLNIAICAEENTIPPDGNNNKVYLNSPLSGRTNQIIHFTDEISSRIADWVSDASIAASEGSETWYPTNSIGVTGDTFREVIASIVQVLIEHDERLTALETRMSAAEAAISALQSQVAGIRSCTC